MVVVRKRGDRHISKSLRQVDCSTWLIGPLLLRRSPLPSDTATWLDSSDGSSYTLTKASEESVLPTTQPASPYISLIHEAGDASAVWSIGESAICKVRYITRGVTSESVSLAFVQSQRTSFDTPEVLHHEFGSDRSYLFLRRLHGRTLDTAWPTLDERWKQHYISAVADACLEMAKWTRQAFGGVDGQDIPEFFLAGPSDDFSVVLAACNEIGMDCSSFCFYHADLGPSNIIVEHQPESGRLGIVDFEICGFFPRAWIRTKFRISMGMDLSSASSPDVPTRWRADVQRALGDRGLEDVAQAWCSWRNQRRIHE